MRRVTIVTGSTGGIGREFVRQISEDEDIDEIWAVGRNKEKLEKLAFEYPKVVPVEADLTKGISEISEKLKSENPEVRILVNNAGAGYLGYFENMEQDKIESLCTLNCTAPALLVSACLPYMKEGSGIINISSSSSFQPNPYLTMYSASKVFVKNFSRALGVELKKRGIKVTCSCPGWVDTGMLPKEKNGKKIHYTGMISAEKVVSKALADLRRGKELSLPSFFAKYFRLYSKYMPTKLVMGQWAWIMRKYV